MPFPTSPPPPPLSSAIKDSTFLRRSQTWVKNSAERWDSQASVTALASKSLFVTSSQMHSLLDSRLNTQPDTKVKHICLWWSRELSKYLYLVLWCGIVVNDASDMTTKRPELACSLVCSASMADPDRHLPINLRWLFAFWEQTLDANGCVTLSTSWQHISICVSFSPFQWKQLLMEIWVTW
jgi:hypothetical protein